MRELLVAAQELSDRASETRSEPWALRYLETSRPTSVLAPAPLSPADQAKISYAQADLVVHVITTVLDGLGLSNEVWEQGCDIAMRELKAASEEGWSPL